MTLSILRGEHTCKDQQSLGIQESQLDPFCIEGRILDSGVVRCDALDGDESLAVREEFGIRR